MSERNFKYNDYRLGFPVFKFEFTEQRRRFKESEALLEMIKEDTKLKLPLKNIEYNYE